MILWIQFKITFDSCEAETGSSSPELPSSSRPRSTRLPVFSVGRTSGKRQNAFEVTVSSRRRSLPASDAGFFLAVDRKDQSSSRADSGPQIASLCTAHGLRVNSGAHRVHGQQEARSADQNSRPGLQTGCCCCCCCGCGGDCCGCCCWAPDVAPPAAEDSHRPTNTDTRVNSNPGQDSLGITCNHHMLLDNFYWILLLARSRKIHVSMKVFIFHWHKQLVHWKDYFIIYN